MKYITFIDDLELQGKSKRTCAEYQRRVNKWVEFLQKQHDGLSVYKATVNELFDYKNSLLSSGMKESTTNVTLNTITLFYDYCERYGMIDKKICPKGLLIVNPVEKLKELSKDELIRIRKWIYQLHGDYRKAMLCLLSTGARPGDIANLNTSDIVHSYGNVFIRVYNYEWKQFVWMIVMDLGIATELYASSLGDNKDRKLFDVDKRELINTANKLNSIREGFHHHLFRYTHTKRLKRNKVPAYIINYLYGEGSLPIEFKKVDNELHHKLILEHRDALFQA